MGGLYPVVIMWCSMQIPVWGQPSSQPFFGRTIATGGIKKGDAQPKGCIKEVLGGLLIQIRRVDMARTETKCRNA